jgi:hypothetical protein
VADTRTPEELIGIIEAKGKEVADALAVLAGKGQLTGVANKENEFEAV